MAKRATRVRLAAGLAVALAWLSATAAWAASAREIDRDATAALENLYQSTPGAKTLGERSRGILIFPSIVKGGFIFGAAYGDGALREHGKTAAYYRSIAASWGLQAGIQSYGYALMFLDEESLEYLHKSDGWEIGTGPSIVVVDEGMGRSLTSTTLQKGVYAFIFDQKGLMAGLGIQGSKITRITPDP